MKQSMKLCWWEWWWFRKWGKSSEGFFRFKTGGGPSKGWSGSPRSKNAGVFMPDQEYTIKIWSLWLVSYPRGGNTHVDSLATLTTSSTQDLPRVILVEDLCTPTSLHRGMPQIHQIKLGPSWMYSISLFLEKDILPEEKFEAEKVRRKAPWFWLSEDRKLYKRSFSGPYLLCVHPKASESLLKELHEGVYGSHIGGRSLSHSAIT